jgi:hypothetical protein
MGVSSSCGYSWRRNPQKYVGGIDTMSWFLDNGSVAVAMKRGQDRESIVPLVYSDSKSAVGTMGCTQLAAKLLVAGGKLSVFEHLV